MACPGLGTGFLPFNTIAHRILLAMHEVGDMTHRDILEYIDIEGYEMHSIGSVTQRLTKNKFIYRARKVPGPPDFPRAVWLYTLKPTKKILYQRKTGAERSRAYRAKRNVVQPSVFTFRGEIKI